MSSINLSYHPLRLFVQSHALKWADKQWSWCLQRCLQKPIRLTTKIIMGMLRSLWCCSTGYIGLLFKFMASIHFVFLAQDCTPDWRRVQAAFFFTVSDNLLHGVIISSQLQEWGCLNCKVSVHWIQLPGKNEDWRRFMRREAWNKLPLSSRLSH